MTLGPERDRYKYGRKPSPSHNSSDKLQNTSIGFLLLDFRTFCRRHKSKIRRHGRPFWAKTNKSSISKFYPHTFYSLSINQLTCDYYICSTRNLQVQWHVVHVCDMWKRHGQGGQLLHNVKKKLKIQFVSIKTVHFTVLNLISLLQLSII